jgi:hypothetical protein
MMRIIFAILLFPFSVFGQSFFWSHAPGEGGGGTPDTITTGVTLGGSSDTYYNGTYYLAQTFTLQYDSKIKKIQFPDWSTLNSPDFDIRVELWDTSAGEPNTKIGESTNVISATYVGNKVFTFNNSITSGVYAFVINYENVVTHNNSNLITFSMDSSNDYTGGTLFFQLESEGWEVETWDFIAKIILEI